jgi:hypothetical protein
MYQKITVNAQSQVMQCTQISPHSHIHTSALMNIMFPKV